jgi:hypothetical protein
MHAAPSIRHEEFFHLQSTAPPCPSFSSPLPLLSVDLPLIEQRKPLPFSAFPRAFLCHPPAALHCVLRQINKSSSPHLPSFLLFPSLPCCGRNLRFGTACVLLHIRDGCRESKDLLYTSSLHPIDVVHPLRFLLPCFVWKKIVKVESHDDPLDVESLGLPSCSCCPLWW